MGRVIEQTTYSPYGEILSGGSVSRFDSEGKEYDSVVGDYDFNFRKYNPGWGLFIQPDTLIQNVYDPQSLNRYMFERGNPYGNKDENGHYWNYVIELLLEHVIPFILVVLLFRESQKQSQTELSEQSSENIPAESAIHTADYDKLPNAMHEATPEQIEAMKKAKGEDEAKELPKEFKIKEPYKEIMNPVNILDKTKEKIEAPVYGRSKGGNRAVPVYVKSDGTVVWGASGTKAPAGTTPVSQVSKNSKRR